MSTYKQPKDKFFIYTRTESDASKGSAQISSAVFHILENMDFKNCSLLRLFADGCGGQNKYSSVICTLIYWLSTKCGPRHLKVITVV